MEFKKTSNKITADEFINQTESGEIDENAKTAKLLVKIPKFYKTQIVKEIKGFCSLAEYIKNSLLNEMEYFGNKDIIAITKKAMLNKIALKDFVKLKLGLIEFATPIEKSPEIEKQDSHKRIYTNNLIAISQNDKQEIEKIAKELQLKITEYSNIKISAIRELGDIFTFDELQKIKKEAQKHKLDLKSYIKERINTI